MTDHDEKLSYVLDDYSAESPEAEAELDALIADVNLQYRMRRYQMIGDVMRHELPTAIDTGFHGAVMERIAAEAGPARHPEPRAAVAADTASSTLSWGALKPLAGLAVAASVAIVTISLWQPVRQEPGKLDAGLAEAEQQKLQELAKQKVEGIAVPVSTRVGSLGTRWKVETESPALQQKLNAYLVNHTEYSNSVQGLIPQARVAGFDSQQ